MPQAQNRAGNVWRNLGRQERRFYRCAQVPQAKRLQVLRALVCSRVLYGASTWPRLSRRENRVLERPVANVIRLILGKSLRPNAENISDEAAFDMTGSTRWWRSRASGSDDAWRCWRTRSSKRWRGIPLATPQRQHLGDCGGGGAAAHPVPQVYEYAIAACNPSTMGEACPRVPCPLAASCLASNDGVVVCCLRKAGGPFGTTAARDRMRGVRPSVSGTHRAGYAPTVGAWPDRRQPPTHNRICVRNLPARFPCACTPFDALAQRQALLGATSAATSSAVDRTSNTTGRGRQSPPRTESAQRPPHCLCGNPTGASGATR